MSGPVYVTVPTGVVPGQRLIVVANDGSDRTTSVIVQQGMLPGSTFAVEFPPTSAPGMTASEETNSGASCASEESKLNDNQTNSDQQLIMCPYKHSALRLVSEHSRFYCDICGVHIPTGCTLYDCRRCNWDACELCALHQNATAANGHPMPSAPEENSLDDSTLASSYPPLNAKSAVTNVYENTSHAPHQTPVKSKQAPEVKVPPNAVPRCNQQPSAPAGQMVVLVKVPPGVPAGAILTIHVPSLPGVVVTAKVPPNVTEFHVVLNEDMTQEQKLEQPVISNWVREQDIIVQQLRKQVDDMQAEKNAREKKDQQQRRMDYAKLGVQLVGVVVSAGVSAKLRN